MGTSYTQGAKKWLKFREKEIAWQKECGLSDAEMRAFRGYSRRHFSATPEEFDPAKFGEKARKTWNIILSMKMNETISKGKYRGMMFQEAILTRAVEIAVGAQAEVSAGEVRMIERMINYHMGQGWVQTEEQKKIAKETAPKTQVLVPVFKGDYNVIREGTTKSNADGSGAGYIRSAETDYRGIAATGERIGGPALLSGGSRDWRGESSSGPVGGIREGEECEEFPGSPDSQPDGFRE